MKYKLLAAAIAVISTNSHALSGKVVDENGVDIAGARIEVMGSNTPYQTDKKGNFDIPLNNIDELHVEANNFNHKILHLHGEDTGPLTITLSKGILEIVDVIGIPIHASKIESAQPVSVLAGDALRKKQASTLGETLKNEVGVHSTSYGGVASSPVIRGLDGPRVLITQNGLDAGDASRIGPDHVVSVEASTAQQIEILRGPATLFYGSGAIGGVVNIVDDRVPKDSEQKAAFLSEYNSVNDETAFSGAYTGGNDHVAFHVDGFWRESSDYDIPGLAELETEEEHEEEGHDEHEGGKLENSASKSSGFNLGASWLLDNGHIGLSYGRLDRLNGIPGHGHGEEEEEHEGMEEEHEEESVLSDLKQDRWQLLSDLQLDSPYFNAINTRIGYTDYQHVEIHEEGEEEEAEGEEHEEEGTVFKNTTLQARVDLLHKEFAGWKGAFSLETKTSDFEAVGEEAFTPPSKTQEIAIALIEEKHVGNLLWQVGARIEQVTLRADDIVLEHGHEGEEDGIQAFDEFTFTPTSLSAGVVWDFTPGYNLGFSVAHAERAPNASELFSAGPHLATRTFEAGALFEIHEDDGELHLEYVGNAEKETSNNIDISLRKFEGDFGFVVNLFYNKISDYYSLNNTGLSTEDLFPEEEAIGEVEEEHGHEEVLPVFIFSQDDATLYGLEVELVWRIHPNFKLTAWGDTVNAELDTGDYLPRTSPTRLGTELNFERGSWDAQFSVVNYYDQKNTAANETATDGYTLVDARVSYTIPALGGSTNVYVGATNLTDEEARAHTSYLKGSAPQPGRNFKVGFHTTF
ncbi:MAG: iron complex outermembrane receptor protein [Lentisphaeria bacterium]|jgi:iron complex outermembrane receptor protein